MPDPGPVAPTEAPEAPNPQGFDSKRSTEVTSERRRTYDGLGRLIHETGTGAEAATTDRTLGYDLADRLTSVGSSEALNPNTYTYNDRGQLLTADGPAGAVNYAYDADGNMTHRSDDKNTTSYGYDSAAGSNGSGTG